MKGKTKIALGTLMTCLIIGNVGFAEDVVYDSLTCVNETVTYDNITVTGGPVYFDQYKKGKVDVNALNNLTISNKPVYVKTGDVNVGNILTINKGANLYVSAGSIKAGTLEVSGYFSMDPSDGVDDENRKIEAEVINLKNGSYFTASKIGEVKADVINHGGSTFITNKITAGTIIMGVEGEGVYPSISAKEVNVDNLNLNKGSFFLGTRGETNAVLNVQNGYDNTGMQVYGTMNIGENGSFDFNSNIKKYNDPAHISQLNIKNGAVVNVNNETMELGNVDMQNSFINIGDKSTDFSVEKLTGSNGTVNVANESNKLVITGESTIESLTVSATGNYAEQLVQNNVNESLQNLANQVVDSTGESEKSAATDLYVAETAVAGAITAEVGEDGNLLANTVNEKVNTSNDAISNMANIALMAWRAENNDMNKRLGELRDSKGEHGIWARMVRGEGTYESIKNQYNTYQLGYDEKLSTNPNWTVGAALSYTEGESSFNGGSGENKHTGFAVYGSYLNDDGSFIDLIAKYARLDHDFDVNGGAGSGDYDTNGYSVSAEYGKRFTQDNGMWIEPQVELTYGKIGSANYTTDNGVSVRQDGMDSLVGRVGFALGKDFKQGNAYVRASYLYDFDGETDMTFSKNGVTRGFEQDLGGGWWEVGVGTNINLSDATHLYMDVEKTYGGDVATPWQWNVGVRYSF